MADKIGDEMSQLRGHLADFVEKILVDKQNGVSDALVNKVAQGLIGRLQADLAPTDRANLQQLAKVLGDLKRDGIPVRAVPQEGAPSQRFGGTGEADLGVRAPPPRVTTMDQPRHAEPTGRAGRAGLLSSWDGLMGGGQPRAASDDGEVANHQRFRLSPGLAYFLVGIAVGAALLALGLAGRAYLQRQQAQSERGTDAEASQPRNVTPSGVQSAWSAALERIDALDREKREGALHALCGDKAEMISECALGDRRLVWASDPAAAKAAMKTLRAMLKDQYDCLLPPSGPRRGGGGDNAVASSRGGDTAESDVQALAACFLDPTAQ